MARCSAAGRMSAAATSARGPSVYATAAVRPRIREIGVFNTTSTACAVAVVRATATGTQGTGLTEICESDPTRTVVATAFNTHSADATVGSPVRQASLGAAIGSGVIWTFGEDGLVVDDGTANGVVITCPTGTGQVCDFYLVWDE